MDDDKRFNIPILLGSGENTEEKKYKGKLCIYSIKRESSQRVSMFFFTRMFGPLSRTTSLLTYKDIRVKNHR